MSDPTQALIERSRAAREHLLRGTSSQCTQEPARGPCFKSGCTATATLPFCHLQDAWQIHLRMRASKMPRRYWRATFESTREEFKKDSKWAFDAASEYVDDHAARIAAGENVHLNGDVGVGKTWLAMVMANGLIDRGVEVLVTSGPGMAQALHAAMGMHDGTLADLRRKLYRTTVLVVDEWTAYYDSPWVATEVQALYRERTDRSLPCILTTNLTKKDVIERSAKSDFKTILDRIFDNVTFLPLDGRPMRQTAKRLGF